MEKREKNIMALYRINGHYITYVEGYVEADSYSEARRKSTHGRHWKISPTEIPIHELTVDYVREVDEVRPSHMLKTKTHPAFGKGSNGHT